MLKISDLGRTQNILAVWAFAKTACISQVHTSTSMTSSAHILKIMTHLEVCVHFLLRGKASLKEADCSLKHIYIKFSLMRTAHHFYIAKLQFWLAVSVKVLVNWHRVLSYNKQGYQKTFWRWQSWVFNMLIRLTGTVFKGSYDSLLIRAFSMTLAHKSFVRGRISCKLFSLPSKC